LVIKKGEIQKKLAKKHGTLAFNWGERSIFVVNFENKKHVHPQIMNSHDMRGDEK
jgi:hypothetical protein